MELLMKYIIDLIDDIREAINNDGNFLVGVIALEKELDENGNNIMAWAKAASDIKLLNESKQLLISLGKTPLNVKTILDELNSYSNEAMMYEVVVSSEGSKKEVIGFSENVEQKTYLILIEE